MHMRCWPSFTVDRSRDVQQATQLVASVVGQEGEEGVFRIAQRVAPDRIISTVDPEARHGHKTSARGFDGYKGPADQTEHCVIARGSAMECGAIFDAALVLKLVDEQTVGRAEELVTRIAGMLTKMDQDVPFLVMGRAHRTTTTRARATFHDDGHDHPHDHDHARDHDHGAGAPPLPVTD